MLHKHCNYMSMTMRQQKQRIKWEKLSVPRNKKGRKYQARDIPFDTWLGIKININLAPHNYKGNSKIFFAKNKNLFATDYKICMPSMFWSCDVNLIDVKSIELEWIPTNVRGNDKADRLLGKVKNSITFWSKTVTSIKS